MRRAALQAFPFARRLCLRKFARTRPSGFSNAGHGLGYRTLSSRRERATSTIITSSMQLRSFSYALVSAAVATGAFYAYRGSESNTAASGPVGSRSSTTISEQTETTRRVIAVGPGSLETGTITGGGPLSKETDDYGRKVLEMLTPEQATQKLRKNEESWLVGRGQGVVRYDVVQIPSNDPIEDDHAEKIIEVPQNMAATENGAAASDWMFWGVFDGHR